MAAALSIEKAIGEAKGPGVMEFLKRPKHLLIGGKWVPAKSGKTFATINPANEEMLAEVAEGDKADVNEAVKAARKAFDQGPWPPDEACGTRGLSATSGPIWSKRMPSNWPNWTRSISA